MKTSALFWQSAMAVAGCLVLSSSSASQPPATVQVRLIENLPAGRELDAKGGVPTDEYYADAFGFVRVPARYSANALPLDRSTPFVLEAVLEQRLPPGPFEFRLRARGSARFLIDESVLLETRPQKPNTSGDDPVPSEPVRGNSPIRPAPYPHQEVIGKFSGDGSWHRFRLVALIGGKGLAPDPGELSVSCGRPGEIPRLLGSDTAPRLTDFEWESFAAHQVERFKAEDAMKRKVLQARVNRDWAEYHRQAAAVLEAAPAPEPPRVRAGTPVWNNIDRFIGARLEAAQRQPTDSLSDLEFLRRLSLDTIGLIPTAAEVREFLEDPPADRRRRALDRWLEHPGWADHWVSYWQDVLAENPGILKPDLNNSGPFRWWLYQSFADNIPFDRLVAELILMEGSVFQGGPAAFAKAALNDAPMAAKADIIAQAFLGEKLSCARCHDAPFHEWTQKNLFGLGAMLEGKPLKLPASSTVPLVEGFRKPRVTVALKPGETIEPEWPFGSLVPNSQWQVPPPIRSPVSSRARVAALIVSPENPRFARVIVNRVWKRYLGAGLVEPAEDWSGAQASHPELLEYLAREFASAGYDLKALARWILSSHLYQRRPVPAAQAQSAAANRLFAGPVRRRMSAEQLVDSLHRCAGKSFGCEELNLNPAGNRPLTEFLNLGAPQRAWQFTALMNERDRPALALPMAQSVVDVLCAFGWRQARQNPVTVREDAPSPMQTLILANGIMATRIVRLSDDSAFTRLALQDQPLEALVQETFLRILSRPPNASERMTARDLLAAGYADRRVPASARAPQKLTADRRVTWGNHLSAEATLIRMEEERRLRLGDAPSGRLQPDFLERYEDLIWSLINSTEFMLMP